MPESVDRAPLAEDRAAGATALLVIDMLSTWDFPDGDAMLKSAEQIAPRIADFILSNQPRGGRKAASAA